MMAIFENVFRSFFSIILVRAINRGTLPTGSITTKRAMVDLLSYLRNYVELTMTARIIIVVLLEQEVLRASIFLI